MFLCTPIKYVGCIIHKDLCIGLYKKQSILSTYTYVHNVNIMHNGIVVQTYKHNNFIIINYYVQLHYFELHNYVMYLYAYRV